MVSSYLRFQKIVGNVCELANRFWSSKLQVPATSVDPRILHDAMHHRCLVAVKRALGLGVKQVLPISMVEARNATHFADAESIRGIAACAAFCMGAVMGGRRPRTLTAIRLSDIKLTAGVANVGQETVLVPNMRITFRQEKFDDLQGPRKGYDMPHADNYLDEAWLSCAFWVHRLLVLRGVFLEFDPLLSAWKGDILSIKPECADFYLFCDVAPNYWIDTAPTSVGTIGSWNKRLLKAMGCPGGGFSAHRSGFVSRTCILAILNSRGQEIPPGTIEVMVRAGGWQAVTGARTVLRIYARPVIDKFIDHYSLSLGYDVGEKEWAARKAAFFGVPRFPEVPVVDAGRTQLPLQLRLLALRSATWVNFMVELNAACANIMSAAMKDSVIMPIRRYRQDRRAFCLYIATHVADVNVKRYCNLLQRRTKLWATCVAKVTADCKRSEVLPLRWLATMVVICVINGTFNCSTLNILQ